jgi:hypothetical protein
VRIKPSFEWLREKIIIEGQVRRLVKDTFGRTPPFEVSDFRQIILNAKKTKVFHGIGPGLEIEVDSKRAGVFVVSTFMGTRVHRILGNLDVNQTASDEYPNGDEAAFYHYRNRRWVYQAYLGFRVRLVPE